MYTEYTVIQSMHNGMEAQLLHSAFKYDHFRRSWYSYISLLDIDYQEGFCCQSCGPNPSTLIMDATSLSFRKELDSWSSYVGSSSVPSSEKKPGSR